MAQDQGIPDRREPAARVTIRDFPGLMSNADPHDLPTGGAIRQVNAGSVQPGVLQVRLGFRPLLFDAF